MSEKLIKRVPEEIRRNLCPDRDKKKVLREVKDGKQKREEGKEGREGSS